MWPRLFTLGMQWNHENYAPSILIIFLLAVPHLTVLLAAEKGLKKSEETVGIPSDASPRSPADRSKTRRDSGHDHDEHDDDDDEKDHYYPSDKKLNKIMKEEMTKFGVFRPIPLNPDGSPDYKRYLKEHEKYMEDYKKHLKALYNPPMPTTYSYRYEPAVGRPVPTTESSFRWQYTAGPSPWDREREEENANSYRTQPERKATTMVTLVVVFLILVPLALIVCLCRVKICRTFCHGHQFPFEQQQPIITGAGAGQPAAAVYPSQVAYPRQQYAAVVTTGLPYNHQFFSPPPPPVGNLSNPANCPPPSYSEATRSVPHHAMKYSPI